MNNRILTGEQPDIHSQEQARKYAAYLDAMPKGFGVYGPAIGSVAAQETQAPRDTINSRVEALFKGADRLKDVMANLEERLSGVLVSDRAGNSLSAGQQEDQAPLVMALSELARRQEAASDRLLALIDRLAI